jgi:hypothetical protein
MKIKYFPGMFAVVFLTSFSLFGQTAVVINDPVKAGSKSELNEAEEDLIRREALPAVRKKLTEDVCEEEFETAGVAYGSFSKPNSDQTLVFYQFCQTGNGMGHAGLILVEDQEVIGNYTSDGGWTLEIRRLPDINQNGLDEFALYYSGGMHQGEGGTGVDILEFSKSGLKGLGWFQADSFSDAADSVGWKVSVKTGKVPIFTRQKYLSKDSKKWRLSGKPARFSLGKTYSKFAAVK